MFVLFCPKHRSGTSFKKGERSRDFKIPVPFSCSGTGNFNGPKPCFKVTQNNFEII